MDTVTINVTKPLTTGKVAKLMQVAPRTVSGWFDKGKLRGYRLPGSLDRRIEVADLVAFMRAHAFPVPPELLPAAVVAYGLASSELPGVTHLDAFDLGAFAAQRPVRGAVVGDADGVAAAYRAGEMLRARNPQALLVLVVGSDVAPVAGAPWDAVFARPVDWSVVERAAGMGEAKEAA